MAEKTHRLRMSENQLKYTVRLYEKHRNDYSETDPMYRETEDLLYRARNLLAKIRFPEANTSRRSFIAGSEDHWGEGHYSYQPHVYQPPAVDRSNEDVKPTPRQEAMFEIAMRNAKRRQVKLGSGRYAKLSEQERLELLTELGPEEDLTALITDVRHENNNADD